jgi:hypothetical protein
MRNDAFMFYELVRDTAVCCIAIFNAIEGPWERTLFDHFIPSAKIHHW